ncbi:MAG: hypothetical protein JSW58_13915, partial [Candidatus Latescibacterota bacterium]
NVPVASRWMSLAAACETLVLNRVDLLSTAPKTIRLPAVLGEAELRRVARGSNGRGERPTKSFGILETEATALVLNTAAIHKGRAILHPKMERPFETDQIAALFNRGVTPGTRSTGNGNDNPNAAPLNFPTESPRPSVVPGAIELVSPIYPASEALAQMVSDCVTSSPNENLESCLEMVSSELFEGAAPRLQASVD